MAQCRILSKKGRKQQIRRRRMRLFVLFTLWQMYQVDREIWVHPMNVERSRKGEYYTLYKDQRNFEDRFFENYRMTVQQFDYLLRLVTPLIKKQDTNYQVPISPEQKLVLTLRYDFYA